MLTIERPSLAANKLVIATVVFAIGFVGSLSALHLLPSDQSPLSLGREKTSVSRSDSASSDTTQDTNKTTDNKEDSKQADAAKKDAAKDVKPVDSAAVDSPATSYASRPATSPSVRPSSSNGTVQVSGYVPPKTTGTVSEPSSSPVAGTDAPAPEQSTPTSVTSPVTSLVQPVADTADNLVPPLCSCGQ